MKEHVFYDWEKLPPIGHAISGIFAGITVSFVAAPIEQVKARLQVQYGEATRIYTGPIHCATSLVSSLPPPARWWLDLTKTGQTKWNQGTVSGPVFDHALQIKLLFSLGIIRHHDDLGKG